MGSLRNPIGPLPSATYWRRRAVALAVFALIVLLVVWALSLGGDGKGSHDDSKGQAGGGPASTITPGPTDSGPAITDRPGGREQADGGDAAGADATTGGDGGDDGAAGGSQDAGGSAGGSGWRPGSGSGTGGDAAGAGGSTAAGGGGAGGGGAALPAGSELPACTASGVSVSLRSLHKSYAGDERPTFRLTTENEHGTACKLDLGRDATTVTIRDHDGDAYWTTDDCTRVDPADLFRLPANSSATHTFVWGRKPSADDCGTPAPGSAKPGGYEIEVRIKGLKKVTEKFTLKA